MKKDVVIVGGGVVGLATAIALAKQTLTVAVIDASPLPLSIDLSSSEPDLRVYAVNHASQVLLSELGAWTQFTEQARISPYRQMYVWDDNSSGVLSFKAQELGLAHLGHIIEERVLKQALLSVIATMDNVSLHVQCTLKSVVVNDDMAFLETSLGDISSKLVIGADGANSWLRKHLSFDCQASPYPHHALVCHVQTEKAHQKTAYQIFLEEGPLAFLPLKNDKQCSIVWSMPKDKAIARMQLSNDEFCQQLEEASQLKLGAISNLSKRVSFPLIERQVNPFIKLRVALVGDALHTIHPLAGLGMNLGLADVDALQKVVQENRRNFDDFLTLRKYERRRKGHVKLITTLMSILSMAFSNAGIPPFLRSIGMNSISQSAFLKSQVIKLASGI